MEISPELRARLVEDTVLAELAVEVTASLSLGDVLEVVVQGLVRSLGVDAAYLWLESSAGAGRFDLAARAGLEPPFEQPPPALARLRHADEHLCTNHVDLGGGSGPGEWLAAHSLCAIAGYPLVFRSDRLGLLAVYSAQPLELLDFRRLFLFAQQAAVAIQNARLFTQVSALRERLTAENAYLRSSAAADTPSLVGGSPGMQQVLSLIAQVAPTDATVLIEGETGTGKELVARAIHDGSRRSGRPLVKLNCGAISPTLIESELFGHERGAFTGATTSRAGRFELADGGTLFLDEIGELPVELQPKLLRALQEREVERVGGSRPHRVDVRVVAATNRTLSEEVRAGRFRADLFYRLSVFPIAVPALRERREDIGVLADAALDRARRRLGRSLEGFTYGSRERMGRYDWPGNVRELMNVVERAAILASADLVEVPASFLPGVAEVTATGESLRLEDAQRRHLQAVLARSGGRIEGPDGAAELLDLAPSTLRSLMRRLSLRP